MQFREPPVKAGRRRLPPDTQQQNDPLSVQAAAGKGEHLERAAVEPVGVVGDHQHREGFGKIRQQGKTATPIRNGSGATGCAASPNAASSACACLPGRSATLDSTGRRSWCSPANAGLTPIPGP